MRSPDTHINWLVKGVVVGLCFLVFGVFGCKDKPEAPPKPAVVKQRIEDKKPSPVRADEHGDREVL